MSKRPGFKKQATIYNIRFEGDEALDGLEVKMRSLPIRQFLKITESAATAAQDPVAQAKTTRMMFTIFAGALVEWNLQDEFGDDVPAVLAQCVESGQEVPASGRCKDHAEAEDECPVTGVLGQETDFIFRIFGEWQAAMGGVSAPLDSNSPSGRQFQEASLPMDVS